MKVDIVPCGVVALASVLVPLVNSAAVTTSASSDDIMTIAFDQLATTVTIPVTAPDGIAKTLALTYPASDTTMAIANTPETQSILHPSAPAWVAAEKALVKHGVAFGGFAAEAGEEGRVKEVEAMATTVIISKRTDVAHHSHATGSVKTWTLGHLSPASANSLATCDPAWWGLLPEGVSVTPCSLTAATHTPSAHGPKLENTPRIV